ncbi:4-hydroxythreonine-4-phosphate dehydrogenase [Rhodovulum sp. PH10]|uniref:4-hydroxythreonine-4-phosphate dehydrogenase PdxA n=1 Tax=Rhodovulum sp. PH10 TaxID=1187851 RepID=UPI00027C2D55|nr:4-hydroxythreonine-4-phosphate dehydrogenase PdxA [Rhodovulum sp. PH10]EJW10006.1 4-hydroxythreonine-4-phosphate dehydrogenase [Rhodovulum sp. PH10]
MSPAAPPPPPGPSWLVLADDLTGAADCAVAFAARGYQGVVVLDGDRPPADAGASPQASDDGSPSGTAGVVLAVDTDGRRLDPAGAPARQRAALAAHLRPGDRIFAKIDSTLRGHVAAETTALLEALAERESAPRTAFVAPAFPANGRTTEAGRVRVHGRPLAEATPLSRRHAAGLDDPGDLPARFAAVGVSADTIPLACVRRGAEAVRAAVSSAIAAGRRVLVCDAVTDEDLAIIAAATLPLADRLVFVGSGGLSGALAATERPDGRAPPAAPETPGPVLVVVGSLADVSRKGSAKLSASGRVATVTLPEAVLRDAPSSPAAAELTARIEAALATGDVLVETETSATTDLVWADVVGNTLAEIVAPVAPRLGGMIVPGGGTLRPLLARMGVTGIRLCAEIEPGIPLGRTIGATALPIVTKAGSFGDEHSLAHCLDRLSAALGRPSATGTGTDGDATRQKPVVAVTMGDPSGIGPEIVVRALAGGEMLDLCRPLVIGDAARLEEAAKILGVPVAVRRIERAAEAGFARGTIDCVDLGVVPPGHPFGVVSPLSGEAAYRYVARAAAIVAAGEADAICTAPLSKEALHAAGHPYPGHTELLAELTGTPEVSMMLVGPRLRVVHVTTHLGLVDAVAAIEPGLVARTIARGRDTLVAAGVAQPRIGVAAINPHAGEHGLFGRGEEEAKIVPAILACRAKGYSIEGPLPADTLFFRAQRGDFDLVVAMYHDQGHIPIKVTGIESGVNVTVGLPVVRTSVDHGTAFDIAGLGIADARSMIAALTLAADLARRARAPASPRSSEHHERPPECAADASDSSRFST